MDAVAPSIAIIWLGEDNPYGHPSPELLERLEASGARTLRTDRDGAVRTVTDGDRLEIPCFMVCAVVSNVTYFKARGSAKLEPERSAITKSLRLLAIHDFSYIEGARRLRFHRLKA